MHSSRQGGNASMVASRAPIPAHERMLSVEGYTVGKCLHDSRKSAVYAGSRVCDGRPIVLKTYRSRHGGENTRAERELRLLERIQSDRVVRPVEVARSRDGLVLVLERMRGISLERYRKGPQLPLGEFLWIALGITRALADVHAARVIHKDIKPGNVLVDTERKEVCLIDFSIASEFGRADGLAPLSQLEGTLCYIAPEQTGRTGLGVDFRTDLYSLGASFYETLTGEPPFRALRPADLVCAHLAQRPVPPSDRCAEIPITLSRIVCKLLEKDPELRYQTARGLEADLEQCCKQLETEGSIDDDMLLGTTDVSDRLRFPQRLYGRGDSIRELQHALDRVSEGSAECVFLSGAAGIGKSSLAGTLREPVVRAGGFFAEAKFDVDRRERPYAGVASAIEGLTRQLLASSPDRVSEWQLRIRTGVGGIVGVLVDLAPSLEFLLDDRPVVPSVGAQEERGRISLAFARLLRAIARPEQPLVLFCDDIQWADAGSLGLLEDVALHPPDGLLLIAGYRDNEIAASATAKRFVDWIVNSETRIRTIELEPLSQLDTEELLADVLGRSPADTAGIARWIGPKSQHNPFLVRRLLLHLWDRDLVWYEHGTGWVWDEHKLGEAEITDDVAGMVALRISGLSAGPQRLIKIASLMGNVFDVELLLELSSLDRAGLVHELLYLVEQGLLAPCREGFMFVHDRVREAAQSCLSAGERACLHHAAARILLDRTDPKRLSAVLFQLSDHLIGASDELDECERRRALEILGLAGTSSFEKGAPDSASHYLGAVRTLLHPTDWQERRTLAFDAHLRGAEAELQLENFESAHRLLTLLEKQSRGRLERARVIAAQVAAASIRLDDSATEIALAGLRALGIHWPKRPSALRARVALWQLSWILRGPVDDRMFERARDLDPGWLAPLLIIRAAGARLAVESNRLTCLAISHLLRTYKKYGFVESPSYALLGLANLWITVQGDFGRARRYAAGARLWSERHESSPTSARSRLAEAFLIEPWFQPRRSCLTTLERRTEVVREQGDLEYVHLALHHRDALAALSGISLTQVSRMANDRRARRARVVMRRVYGLLMTPEVDWRTEERRLLAYLEPMTGEALYASDHIVAVLCIAGRWELAFQVSERVWPRVRGTTGLATRIVDHHFYRGMVSAVLACSAEGRARRRYLRVLRTCLGRVQRWARQGPDFVHMARLLEAELLCARGASGAALTRYIQAANGALEAGYVHHAALAHERRGTLLRQLRRSVEFLLVAASASQLYQEWGAVLKVAQLRAETTDLAQTRT